MKRIIVCIEILYIAPIVGVRISHRVSTVATMAPLTGMSEAATREIDGLIAEYTKGSAVDAHVFSSNDRIFHLLEDAGKVYTLQVQSKFVCTHPPNGLLRPAYRPTCRLSAHMHASRECIRYPDTKIADALISIAIKKLTM